MHLLRRSNIAMSAVILIAYKYYNFLYLDNLVADACRIPMNVILPSMKI